MSTAIDLHLIFETAHIPELLATNVKASLASVNKRPGLSNMFDGGSDVVFPNLLATAEDSLHAVRGVLPSGFHISLVAGPLDKTLPGIDPARQGVTLTISPAPGK